MVEMENKIVKLFSEECPRFPLDICEEKPPPEPVSKLMTPPQGTHVSPMVPKEPIVVTSSKKPDLQNDSAGYPEPPHT
jgi:hypothetical protein